MSLWVLGLRCHFGRVESVLRGRGKVNVGHHVVLMHDTSPKHLILTTYPEHLFDLDRIFNLPALESFELRVDVVGKPGILTHRGTLQPDVCGTLVSPLLRSIGRVDTDNRHTSPGKSTNPASAT